MTVPASARLRFRRMAIDDLDDMSRLLGDPQVMAFYPRTRTREEAADWISWNERDYARDGYGLWILHDEDGLSASTYSGWCPEPGCPSRWSNVRAGIPHERLTNAKRQFFNPRDAGAQLLRPPSPRRAATPATDRRPSSADSRSLADRLTP